MGFFWGGRGGVYSLFIEYWEGYKGKGLIEEREKEGGGKKVEREKAETDSSEG